MFLREHSIFEPEKTPAKYSLLIIETRHRGIEQIVKYKDCKNSNKREVTFLWAYFKLLIKHFFKNPMHTYDRKPETNGKPDVSPVDFFLIYL